jgi:hypothetical protein
MTFVSSFSQVRNEAGMSQKGTGMSFRCRLLSFGAADENRLQPVGSAGILENIGETRTGTVSG